jgi:hypothetical protein
VVEKQELVEVHTQLSEAQFVISDNYCISTG